MRSDNLALKERKKYIQKKTQINIVFVILKYFFFGKIVIITEQRTLDVLLAMTFGLKIVWLI